MNAMPRHARAAAAIADAAVAGLWRAPVRRCLIAGILVLLVAGCAREPAEQRLRATIAAIEAALEARAVGDVLDHVATDFIGGDGSLERIDRRQLQALLRGVLLRHRDIGVLLGPLELTLHGEDRATVRVDAMVTGGSGGLLPETGRRIRIDSGWRLDDGDWRCISARWGEAVP